MNGINYLCLLFTLLFRFVVLDVYRSLLEHHSYLLITQELRSFKLCTISVKNYYENKARSCAYIFNFFFGLLSSVPYIYISFLIFRDNKLLRSNQIVEAGFSSFFYLLLMQGYGSGRSLKLTDPTDPDPTHCFFAFMFTGHGIFSGIDSHPRRASCASCSGQTLRWVLKELSIPRI
jgi:hypothetical protein